MSGLLVTIHTWFGYTVFVVAAVMVFLAFKRAKDSREFNRAPYAIALVLVDIQVLLGLITYVTSSAWNMSPAIAYIHPLLALAALGVGHALVGRAGRTQMASDAHRLAGRGLLGALVLVLAAIGVASMA